LDRTTVTAEWRTIEGAWGRSHSGLRSATICAVSALGRGLLQGQLHRCADWRLGLDIQCLYPVSPRRSLLQGSGESTFGVSWGARREPGARQRLPGDPDARAL